MIHVTAKYHQALRGSAGVAVEAVALGEGATVRDLMTRLICSHEALISFNGRCAVAVNEQFALPQTKLSDGDTVDLMPPAPES